MTEYLLNLTPMNENAPRILWRNDLFIQEPTDEYDTFIDPMTWNLDEVPATIILDIPLDRPIACNAIGIARGDWSGQTIAVAYDDGSGWTDLGVWQPSPGQPFLGLFEYQTAANWRITITNGTLTASVIRFGMALGMQRNTYSGVAPLTKQINKMPNAQLGAHFVGIQALQTRREQKFDFNKLDAEWVRAYLKPWIEASKREAAFVAWRPGQYPRDVVYGFCDDDIKPSNEMANGMMAVKFGIEGGKE